MKISKASSRHDAAALIVVLTSSLYAHSATAQDAEDVYEEHEVDEIIVEGAAIARTVRGLAQPTSILGGDALARHQAASIGETVSQELGVSSTYFGPVSSRPVIRGQFGERVRVLTNGLDSLDAAALSEDHAVGLDTIAAERIEIVRGPATLLYGSGAAGGLVNVVDTRIAEQPLDDGFSGALALGSDSAIGKQSGAGQVKFGTDTIAVHLDYFRRDTDDVEIPGFAESAILRAMEEEEEEGEEHEEEEEAFGVVENTDSRAEGGAAAFSLLSDNGYVGFSVSRYDNNYGIPGHQHHHEEEEAPGAVEEEEEAVRIDLDQTRFDVRGEYGIGDGASVRFKLGQSEYKHVELEGEEIGTVFETDGFDGRVELRHGAVGNVEGTFGLQQKVIDFSAVGEEAYVPASDTSQTGLFIFEEWSLNDQWALQASGRIERQKIDVSGLTDYSGSAFGGSFGAIWNVSETFSTSLNYALTERHPNAAELYADGAHIAVNRVERGSVVLGNGILKTEKSSNVDLVLHGDMGRFEWTIAGFVNDIDDYILLAPTAEFEDELQVFEYTQTDARLTGFEAEARIELLDANQGHIHTRLFADLVRGEDRQTGLDLPRIPPLRYGIGLHYTRDRLDAGIEARYHEEQDRIAPNELPTDSYTLLSAEVSYTFGDPGLFVFVRGTNLTDEDARQHTSPLKDTMPLPGQSIQLGLRYDF